MLTALFATALLIVVWAGARFPLYFYRGKYGKTEKKVSWILGFTAASLVLALKVCHMVASEKVVDIVTTTVMIVICLAGILFSYWSLRRSDRATP